MRKKFSKWHGCGNDFVFFIDLDEEIKNVDLLARRLCDRHFGIGADGLIFILPPQDAANNDFRMKIINLDGSEAQMCGNGIRCFAALAYTEGLTAKTTLRVETAAGIIIPQINLADGQIKTITVDMGEPILAAPQIPVAGYGSDKIVNAPLAVNGKEYRMTCVSMGNPHAVFFRAAEDALDELAAVGPQIEIHRAFPEKVNAEFAYVRDPAHIRMRVWERGAAMTLACGTGSCATLAAAVLEGRADRAAEIEVDGGKLAVEWRESDNHLYMTGPAERVFDGEVEI